MYVRGLVIQRTIERSVTKPSDLNSLEEMQLLKKGVWKIPKGFLFLASEVTKKFGN